jgi:hypothetical protein
VAYIGRPSIVGNFVKLDAISVVNGQAAYTMQNNSVNFVDYSTVNQFMVSLNSVVQSPGSSFTVSGSTITFASNLVTGDVIDFIIVFGNSLSAGTPTDATVSTAKLADDAVTTAKLADNNVTTAKVADNAITLAKMASGTDGNIISYDASGNPVAVATGSAGQILTSAGAGAPPVFATAASAGKILGVAADWSSIGESTTSSSFVDIPSNKGRISYTTVGANSNFIVTNMVNWKQTGNHPNYLYFGNVRYLIELQSDLSVLATGNSRGYMININEGTLITDNGSTTENDFLDPGTLAAGTDIYFQPQFNTQSTLTVAGIQTVIWEIAA